MSTHSSKKMILVQQLGGAVNANVIQLEHRRYPSLVIQGDSMSILYGMAQSAAANARAGTPEAFDECLDELTDLEELLRGYLIAYEQALLENDIPLPYVGSYVARTR